MLTYDDALSRILSAAAVLSAESTPLDAALGRVLAADIAARAAIPPFANSMMDGYACIASDTAGASPQTPALLAVVAGESAAGRPYPRPIATGEAVPISTGAAIPAGATAVAMVEETRPGDRAGTVEILEEAKPGQSIRPAGEDAEKGARILAKGVAMTPGAIALAAAGGHSRLPLVRRPRAAIIATGDELVSPGEPLLPGQIYESNLPMLRALVEDAGAECVLAVVAADDRGSLETAFDAARAAGADVIVSSGGVSVGRHDLVRAVFEERGALDFWRVAVRPGKPFAFGLWDERLFFGLPGNPASSMVTFELFVRPPLRRLAGHAAAARPIARSVLAAPISHEPGRRSFVRAVTGYVDGRLSSVDAGRQASNLIAPLAAANSLVIVPEDVERLEAGAAADVMLLGEAVDVPFSRSVSDA